MWVLTVWSLFSIRCRRKVQPRRHASTVTWTTTWSPLRPQTPTSPQGLSAGLTGEAPSMDVSGSRLIASLFSLSLLVLFNLLFSAEATNHDRNKEKPNGSLEETMAVEMTTSPPRTTLLGTIFSPVFNFFSPAKNGKKLSLPVVI